MSVKSRHDTRIATIDLWIADCVDLVESRQAVAFPDEMYANYVKWVELASPARYPYPLASTIFIRQLRLRGLCTESLYVNGYRTAAHRGVRLTEPVPRTDRPAS